MGCYLLDIIVGLAWAFWTSLSTKRPRHFNWHCYFGFGLDILLDCFLLFSASWHFFAPFLLYLFFASVGYNRQQICRFDGCDRAFTQLGNLKVSKRISFKITFVHVSPYLCSLCLPSAFGIRLMSASTLANVRTSVHIPTATRHLPSSATSRPTSVSMMRSSPSCADFLDAERHLVNLAI